MMKAKFLASAHALFASLGEAVEAAPGPFPFSGFELAGIIGFGGDARGHVMVAASRACVRALHPLRDRPESIDEADWIAELSNQLLGRFKNNLLPCGATISIGTPVVAASGELKGTTDGEALSYVARTPHGDVSLYLAWRAPPGLVLTEPAKDAKPILSDSEYLIF